MWAWSGTLERIMTKRERIMDVAVKIADIRRELAALEREFAALVPDDHAAGNGADDSPEASVAAQALAHIDSHPERFHTAPELAKALGLSKKKTNYLRAVLVRAFDAGKVKKMKDERGKYCSLKSTLPGAEVSTADA